MKRDWVSDRRFSQAPQRGPLSWQCHIKAPQWNENGREWINFSHHTRWRCQHNFPCWSVNKRQARKYLLIYPHLFVCIFHLSYFSYVWFSGNLHSGNLCFCVSQFLGSSGLDGNCSIWNAKFDDLKIGSGCIIFSVLFLFKIAFWFVGWLGGRLFGMKEPQFCSARSDCPAQLITEPSPQGCWCYTLYRGTAQDNTLLWQMLMYVSHSFISALKSWQSWWYNTLNESNFFLHNLFCLISQLNVMYKCKIQLRSFTSTKKSSNTHPLLLQTDTLHFFNLYFIRESYWDQCVFYRWALNYRNYRKCRHQNINKTKHIHY